MENPIIKAARIMLALAMIVFGVQHFIYRDFLPKLEPVPAWVPARTFLAYCTGAIIILAAIGIATRIMDRLSAMVLGILFMGSVLCFHLSVLVSNLHDPDKWACICEELAIGSGTLILYGYLFGESSNQMTRKIMRIAGILFALSLTIFGTQHFMYADFIATLIPVWIPFPLFWAYFVGIVFFLVAISIVTKKKTYLGLTLMRIMFFFWEISLHIPRVIGKPTNMDEWTSAAVALAMCACSFVIASTMPGKQMTAHALQRQNV
ncbi:MAG: hypothetical protein JST75_19285 [Bacteroidetes bacterium]|nr:hypothetical protein [Bacteroidota bacterium]